MVDTSQDNGTFANTGFEARRYASLPPLVDVQQPVQNDAGSKLVSSIDGAVQTAGGLFAKAAVTQGQTAAYGVLSNYQDDISKLADAMDSGMTPQEGLMRVRALTSQYVANYPTLIKDIDDLQSKVMSSSGMANVITTGNDDYQRQKKLQDEASANGWPDVDSYQQFLRDHNSASASADKLATIKDQYDTLGYNDAIKGYQRYTTALQSAQPWVDNQFDQAQAAINQSDKSPQAISTIIQGLSQSIAKGEATFGLDKATAGPNAPDLSFFTTSIQDRIKAFNDFNTGTISKSVYDNQLSNMKAQTEIAIRQNSPDLARLATASQMLGPIGSTVLGPAFTDEATKLLVAAENGNVDPATNQPILPKGPDFVSQDTNVDQALQGIKTAINSYGSSPTSNQIKSTTNSIGQVVQSVGTYGGAGTKPQDFTSVMNFLADPTVGRIMSTPGAGVSGPAATAALNVIDQNYSNVLLPLVRNQWDEATVFMKNPAFQNSYKTPMAAEAKGVQPNQVVVPTWNGAGVEFKAAPGYQNDALVGKAVQNLNSTVSGPLNTYIRAATHLQGSQDYAKFFNDNIRDRLFAPDSPEEGLQKGDMSSLSKPSAIDMRNGGNDLTAGMRNNNPGNIKFSNINWQGQVGPSKNLDQGNPQVVFDTAENGMRAAAKNVLSKYHSGAETVRELIAGANGWTPGYEPGAEGVAKAAGFGLDQKINMNNPDVLAKVLRGIVTQEHGPASKAYTDSLIMQGVKEALS